MTASASPGPLPDHGRFPYSAITSRPDLRWPQGKRLAVYIAINHEHFAFGSGLGAAIGPDSPHPDVLNHSWREYGNRVGAWNLLELMDELALPAASLINTALLDHCPELLHACVARGDEIVAHGHTNSHRQSDLPEDRERDLVRYCRDRIRAELGVPADGWLSPWISESPVTPDLLQEASYRYTLNWCHDDQPIEMKTRGGTLWSIPYPQELNDVPMIIHRRMDAAAFGRMIVDNFLEMLDQSTRRGLVMGIALHPYIVGQPYRLRHLRQALQQIRAIGADAVWWTRPGDICEHMFGAPS